MTPTIGRRLGMVELGVVFLKIGAVAFGGLLSALVLVERELVERRAALTSEDIKEAVTYTRLLPGSGGPLIVSYLGYKIGGWGGSAVATAAFLLPGVSLMLALAVGFVGLSAIPAVAPAIGGLLAAVVGLQAVATYKMGKTSLRGWLTALLFVLALIGALTLDLNAAALAIGAGIVGAFFLIEAPDANGSNGVAS